VKGNAWFLWANKLKIKKEGNKEETGNTVVTWLQTSEDPLVLVHPHMVGEFYYQSILRTFEII